MTKLHLGKDLYLPLSAVTEKIAWLGRTGSGKTYGAQKLAELMLEAGAQVGAIDPVGVWPALRIPKTKGGQSFEVVVFGGLRGDLPLEPTAGVLIADIVCERGLSFVVDVSQFIPAEQQRFVHAFADRFFHRKKSAPSAVHLFMEECQEFIPENPSREEAKTLGVMQRLWKLGRNFGIGGSLISQRPQEIAKKALNMSGTLFAFQMTGPQERKAVRAWVADKGVAVDIEAILQKLEIGQPHVESPMFLEISRTVRILPKVTADLSSTPEVGVATAAKRPLTPIDVEQLKDSMAATIEKTKAEDPRELRKTIADLRAQLARAEKATPAKATDPAAGRQQTAHIKALRRALEVAMKFIVQINAEGFLKDSSPADREALQKALDGAMQGVTRAIDQRLSARNQAIERLLATAAKTSADLKKILAGEDVTVDLTVRHNEPYTVAPTHQRRAAPAVPARPPAARAEGVSPAQQRILDQLAWLESVGVVDAERTQLALLADASPTSSAYANNLGGLRSAGLIDYGAPGHVLLTPNGRDAAHQVDAPQTSMDLQDAFLRKLPSAKGRILQALIRVYPQGLKREALAELAGASATSSAYANNLGSLRSLGVIDYRGGEVFALPVLFLS